jgi:four helix bundle protein
MKNEYKRFTELNVWIEARRLVAVIYTSTKSYPKEDQFGLVNQIRRRAVSVQKVLAKAQRKTACISSILQEVRCMN